MFIKTHGIVDWSSVMTEMLLPQRGAKTVGGGWDCLFIGMHLALKTWFGRKRSVQILVEHNGGAGLRLQTPSARLSCPSTESSKGCKGVGLCPRLMLGCHALGARVRHTHLVADPGKQVCRTARLGPKVLLGHCSMT